MTSLEFQIRRSDLWIAYRQEALRWQALLVRVPLFLITLGLLYGLGFGLLRNAALMTVPLQVLILIGYGVVYWIFFLALRLWQGRMRAGRLVTALFSQSEVRDLSLVLEDSHLRFTSGDWHLKVKGEAVRHYHSTADFLVIDSALIPWIPLRKSPELLELLAAARKHAA